MPTATRTPRCKYCTNEGTIFKNSEWRCDKHDITIKKLDELLGIETVPALSLRDYLIEMAERNVVIEVDFRDRTWPHLAEKNDLGKMRLGDVSKFETNDRMINDVPVQMNTIQLHDILGQGWAGYSSTQRLANVKMRPISSSVILAHDLYCGVCGVTGNPGQKRGGVCPAPGCSGHLR